MIIIELLEDPINWRNYPVRSSDRSCDVFFSKIFVSCRKRRHNLKRNSGIHEGFPGKCNVFCNSCVYYFLVAAADASLEKGD